MKKRECLLKKGPLCRQCRAQDAGMLAVGPWGVIRAVTVELHGISSVAPPLLEVENGAGDR